MATPNGPVGGFGPPPASGPPAPSTHPPNPLPPPTSHPPPPHPLIHAIRDITVVVKKVAQNPAVLASYYR